MVVDSRLKELANIFNKEATLYAVGGFVRDNILQIGNYDIDVCSSLRVERVKEILEGTQFHVIERNFRMGTVVIVNEDFKVEYTTFRVDSYDKRLGNHSPIEVTFTNDIMLDALRRDFKCNAIYYDIFNDEIVDVLNGIDDIKKKQISTTDNPDNVFEADGLRILRLVRFASELGFSIEEETLESAKKNAWRVKDISIERVKDELDKIFIADQKHKELKLVDAHIKGVRLLDELGLLELLLPEVCNLKGLAQPKKYHLYDAFEHTMQAFAFSQYDVRWATLCHDIGKRPCIDNNGNMHGHDEVGAEMARNIANRFKFSNDEKAEFIFLIKNHMYDLNEDTREAKIRRFVVYNIWAIDKLIKLKQADCYGACGEVKCFRIEKILDDIKKEGIPTSIKDLKVNGKDLIDAGILEKDRAIIMRKLWDDIILKPSLNTREASLNYINRRVEKK